MSSWSSYKAAPSLHHLKQAQRDMSNFGAAVEQLLKQPAPQTRSCRPRSCERELEFRSQRNEVRQEPPTQLEVARLVAATSARASEWAVQQHVPRPRGTGTGTARGDLVASMRKGVVRRRRVHGSGRLGVASVGAFGLGARSHLTKAKPQAPIRPAPTGRCAPRTARRWHWYLMPRGRRRAAPSSIGSAGAAALRDSATPVRTTGVLLAASRARSPCPAPPPARSGERTAIATPPPP